jgi:hypothetical protein
LPGARRDAAEPVVEHELEREIVAARAHGAELDAIAAGGSGAFERDAGGERDAQAVERTHDGRFGQIGSKELDRARGRLVRAASRRDAQHASAELALSVGAKPDDTRVTGVAFHADGAHRPHPIAQRDAGIVDPGDEPRITVPGLASQARPDVALDVRRAS